MHTLYCHTRRALLCVSYRELAPAVSRWWNVTNPCPAAVLNPCLRSYSKRNTDTDLTINSRCQRNTIPPTSSRVWPACRSPTLPDHHRSVIAAARTRFTLTPNASTLQSITSSTRYSDCRRLPFSPLSRSRASLRDVSIPARASQDKSPSAQVSSSFRNHNLDNIITERSPHSLNHRSRRLASRARSSAHRKHSPPSPC